MEYLRIDKRNCKGTLARRRGQLRHLLEWMGPLPFLRAPERSPGFPEYLLDKDNPLSDETIRNTCDVARRFFTWAKDKYPPDYERINKGWIDTIRSETGEDITPYIEPVHEYYTLEEVQKITNLEAGNIREKRDIAAYAFLFLSGMRLGAFLTLPVFCVDFELLTVKQLPEYGVRTKNMKAAETLLIRILPDLLAVAVEWDGIVRAELGDRAMWYPPIVPNGNILSREEVGSYRGKAIYRGFRHLCNRAGVEYKSPRCLRHGHVMYLKSKAKNMDDYKAISQNVMHSNLALTDSYYGRLQQSSYRTTFTTLGTDDTGSLRFIRAAKKEPGLLKKVLPGSPDPLAG